MPQSQTAPVPTTKVDRGEDYTGNNFRHGNLAHRRFENCVFDGADMSYCDCTGAQFIGCSFKETLCYRTNFRDAVLAASAFEPADCYGMTITLTCKTFQNVKISQQWWMGWLMFLTSMLPAKTPIKDDLHGKLIELIGAERYVRLKSMFERRDA